MSGMRNPWIRLSTDAWRLSLEASAVIAQRTIKLAAGGPAEHTEAVRMVSEKLDSGMALQLRAMTGGLGATPQAAAAAVLTHYRRKVRANRRRLSRL